MTSLFWAQKAFRHTGAANVVVRLSGVELVSLSPWVPDRKNGFKELDEFYHLDELRTDFHRGIIRLFDNWAVVKTPQDQMSQSHPLQYLGGSWNRSRGSATEGPVDARIVSRFAEAPRKHLCNT